jgi:hypothetical protein
MTSGVHGFARMRAACSHLGQKYRCRWPAILRYGWPQSSASAGSDGTVSEEGRECDGGCFAHWTDTVQPAPPVAAAVT